MVQLDGQKNMHENDFIIFNEGSISRNHGFGSWIKFKTQ